MRVSSKDIEAHYDALFMLVNIRLFQVWPLVQPLLTITKSRKTPRGIRYLDFITGLISSLEFQVKG